MSPISLAAAIRAPARKLLTHPYRRCRVYFFFVRACLQLQEFESTGRARQGIRVQGVGFRSQVAGLGIIQEL